MWTKASDIVYNMLVGHEVGHALYTPNDEEVFKNAPCPLGYINVTEDARIEKLMKRKYPGISKDFHGGYSELHEDDFFSVEDTDLNELTLIDRINLHFKIGAYAMMPFSPAETPLRDAVGRSETFQEAIDAAKAIYDFMKAQQTEEQFCPLSYRDAEETREAHRDLLGIRVQVRHGHVARRIAARAPRACRRTPRSAAAARSPAARSRRASAGARATSASASSSTTGTRRPPKPW